MLLYEWHFIMYLCIGCMTNLGGERSIGTFHLFMMTVMDFGSSHLRSENAFDALSMEDLKTWESYYKRSTRFPKGLGTSSNVST